VTRTIASNDDPIVPPPSFMNLELPLQSAGGSHTDCTDDYNLTDQGKTITLDVREKETFSNNNRLLPSQQYDLRIPDSFWFSVRMLKDMILKDHSKQSLKVGLDLFVNELKDKFSNCSSKALQGFGTESYPDNMNAFEFYLSNDSDDKSPRTIKEQGSKTSVQKDVGTQCEDAITKSTVNKEINNESELNKEQERWEFDCLMRENQNLKENICKQTEDIHELMDKLRNIEIIRASEMELLQKNEKVFEFAATHNLYKNNLK